VADGTNSIYVSLDIGNVVNPTFKVWLNDELKSTVELVANEINYVNLPPELFAANGVIKFQYLDSAYTGKIFSISFPETLDGNLSIQKNGDYWFNAKYTKAGAVTITVDSELSTTSENPVQNKVITSALNDKQDKMTIDSALSTTSANPVQNKVVTGAISSANKNITSIANNLATYRSANNTNSMSVPCGSGYGAYLVAGFVQMVGGIMYVVTIQGGSVSSAKIGGPDIVGVSFSYSNGYFKITSDITHSFSLSVIGDTAR
jgi:hypothetical protein